MTTDSRERDQRHNAPDCRAPSGSREHNDGTRDPQDEALLGKSYISPRRGEFAAYSRRLDIEPWPTEFRRFPPCWRKRGRVTTFSRKSRLSMFRAAASIRLEELSRGWWISLTYHHRCPAGKKQLIDDIEAWTQAVRRKFPRMVYVKRLEFQERGFPHWHLLVWTERGNMAFDTPRAGRWMHRLWHRIAEPTSKHHAEHGPNVQPLDTWRKTLAYISKYCAKEQDGEQDGYTGRRWSTSYHLPRRPYQKGEITLRQMVRLRRAALLLVRLRRGSSTWLDRAARNMNSMSLLLREGEAERLLRIAGIEPEEATNDPDPP